VDYYYSVILSHLQRGYQLDNFIAGKGAIQISDSWALRNMQQKGFDFGVVPILSDRDNFAAKDETLRELNQNLRLQIAGEPIPFTEWSERLAELHEEEQHL
jgi:hypothetical protein